MTLFLSKRGRGFFRRFRDYMTGLGKLDEWYKYRDQAEHAAMMSWAQDQGLEVVKVD